MVLKTTFRLDESLPTTTLLPPASQSTQLLRRNQTTQMKYNLLSSIALCSRHPQIGHGDINKIILQLLDDLLTPPCSVCQRKAASDAHYCLGVLSSLSQTTKKNSSLATI